LLAYTTPLSGFVVIPYGALNPVIFFIIGFEGVRAGVGGCVISSLVIMHALT